MAMRILSSRMVSANMPMRICVTSSSPMSSSSSSSSSDVVKSPTKKRESFRSMLASVFGGHVDPADPKDKPIPANEVNFPDVTEQATGMQKLFLLAFENGYLDPFCNLPTERKGAGTKDNPVKIESFVNERLVGCVCESTQNYIKFTYVHRGEPKRCSCGHWMELVDAPKFWQDIPKEDLLTIPYFQFMEQEGKLDALLAGKLDEQEQPKLH